MHYPHTLVTMLQGVCIFQLYAFHSVTKAVQVATPSLCAALMMQYHDIHCCGGSGVVNKAKYETWAMGV